MTIEAIAAIIGSTMALLASIYKIGDKLISTASGMTRQLTDISYGLTGIRDDVSTLKSDLKELRQEFKEQEVKVDIVQRDYIELRSTVTAMIHVQDSRIDALNSDVKEIKGIIKSNSPHWLRRDRDLAD